MESEYGEPIFLSDLLAQGRLTEAVELIGLALDQAPDDASLRSLLALCLEDLGRRDEALDAATAASAVSPDEPYVLWTLGSLLADRRRYKQALPHAERLVELAPDHVDHQALMAHVLGGLDRWTESLAHAERGLELRPDDPVCANLRGLAIRQTQGGEAAATEMARLVTQYPASSWLRELQGWDALAGGESIEAQRHFEHALELDPRSEFARVGMAESVKAENPIYRRLLQFFVRFDRLPGRTRWLIILGGLFAYNRLADASAANPALAPVVYPFMALWIGFIVLSWTSGPLSDFVLSRTERGRHLVKGQELLAARLIAGLVASALVLGVAGFATGLGRLGVGALLAAFMVIPTAAVFQCPRGWPQTTMAVYAGIAGTAGLLGFLAPDPLGGIAFGVCILMAVLGSWIGAFLSSRTPSGS